MRKRFFHCLGIAAVAAFAVVAAIYIFNLWLFSYIPHLSYLILPYEALFFDGLLVFAIGILILFKLPRARVIGGRGKLLMGSGGFGTDAESHEKRNQEYTQVVGFALVIAAAILFLLYLLRIQSP